MELCLQKRWQNTKQVVTIVWAGIEQNHQIELGSNDLSCLRQEWESSTPQECWLNDKVTIIIVYKS